MSKAKLIFEKVLNTFAWIVFIFAVVICAVTVFSTFSDEQNGKELFGYKFLIVASDSMSKSDSSQDEEIFFNAGDIIIIKTVEDTTNLQPGQVISFFSYNPDSFGKTLTHKIREAKYSANGKLIGYVTYGINTGDNDQALVPAESIIGVYEGKIPLMGHVFAFLKTPRGFFVSVIAPTVLLIIYFSIIVGRILGKREVLEYGWSEADQGSYVDEVAYLRQKIALLEGGLLPTEQQPVDYTAPPQQPAQDTCPQDQQKQTPVCACQTAQESQPAPQQQEAVPSDSKRQPAQALCKAIDNQFATYSKVKAKTRNDSTTYYYKNKPLVRVQATDQSIKLSFTAGAVSVCSIRSEEDAVNFVDSLMSNQSAKK